MTHIRQTHHRAVVTVGDGPLTLSQVVSVARGRVRVAVSARKDFLRKMGRSRDALLNALSGGDPVYGVNTGYGAACGNRISSGDIATLGSNLIKYHGCGTGDALGIAETRAAIVCRLACLARGYSGVTVGLLSALAGLLNRGVTPVIPSLGSVGASGDLTPMSYIAACLAGDREAFYRGTRMSARTALSRAGLRPYRLAPKEPLGMLNGTSIMTGIAIIALEDSRSILDAALAATALTVHALSGHEDHFHPSVVDNKPHPGQRIAGETLRAFLRSTGHPPESDSAEHLQDPYSLRCAPQIMGVAYDALRWVDQWIEDEVNSTNDNPILDGDRGEVFMGGNFYGGHVVFAMDAFKSALASVADMMDRQMALLVDKRFNRGLPANLVKVKGEKHLLHHGFKGMQITASALTAEALKNTVPAGSFSRSTESHNQDKVSMGTIAARDAAYQASLVARVAAIHLMAAVQACEIRGGLETRPALGAIVRQVRAQIRETVEDRPMDGDLDALAAALPRLRWVP